MAYHFKKTENLVESINRIITTQVRKASQLLAQKPFSNENVYGARKSFKKIRSLLKLIKGTIRKKNYRKANIFFRDLGRNLSEVRDSEAVIETTQRLIKLSNETEIQELKVLEAFLVKRSQMIAEKSNLEKLTEEMILRLPKITKNMQNWTFKHQRIDGLLMGFSSSYRRGYDYAHHHLDENSSDYDFHEWRKEVKHHRAQSGLMKLYCKTIAKKERLELFNQLSSSLGFIQDCSVLIDVIQSEQKDIPLNEAAIEKLTTIIEAHINQTKKSSLDFGRPAFQPNPSQLDNQLKSELKELVEIA